MSVFDKWNKQINNEMKEQLDKYDNGEMDGGFEKVPYGSYEVKIDSIDVQLNKKTQEPNMCIIWKIIKGDQKGKKIWQWQNIKILDKEGSEMFLVHLGSDLLRKLDTGVEVKFKNYDQFNDLCMDVAEKANTQGLEYALKFYENNDGYDAFEILDIFEP